jgi:hypothetical protein
MATMMELLKKLGGLTKEQQIDIVRLKVHIARKAVEQAEHDREEVRQVLRDYLTQCERMLAKVSFN